MFDNFDFSILDDPEFLEDSVREEIVTPILKRLGYSAVGSARIVRSRSLVHPFVMIGSQKRRIYIVPDYLLIVDGKNGFILDAKAPSEAIVKSDHVEQAFSYAIHPEVRVDIYALCNGHELVVYDVRKFDPVFLCPVADLSERWDECAAVLSPDAITRPFLRDLLPDFGVRALKSGLSDVHWQFFGAQIDNFLKVSDDTVSTFAHIDDNGVKCGMSLDFPIDVFNQLLGFCDDGLRQEIEFFLSRNPFSVAMPEPIVADIHAQLGNPTKSNDTGEEFVPFTVVAILTGAGRLTKP